MDWFTSLFPAPKKKPIVTLVILLPAPKLLGDARRLARRVCLPSLAVASCAMAPKGNRPYEWDSIPGPGAYSASSNQKGEGVMGDAPSFSMVGRKAVPGASSASPGPVYSPRSKGRMGDGSHYTFGSSRDPGQLGGLSKKSSASKAPCTS